MRGERVRQGGMAKIGSLASPRNLIHATRANKVHEITEQIRARIACTPAYIGVAGVGGVCTLTEITISLLQWEKVARFTATDEVLLQYIAKITLSRYVRTQTRAQA